MKLPKDFEINCRTIWGDPAFDAFQKAVEGPPCVSIRINPKKGIVQPVKGEKIPWSSYGFYLPERPSFTYDPLFHSGCYYVQEPSSMFLEVALRHVLTRPSVLLDLCAAPGGKSTLIQSLMPENSLLVSNEPIQTRAQILKDNIVQWGGTHTMITQDFPEKFAPLSDTFDIIVADLPCSGEGMFRKDVQSISEWSIDNVEKCRGRQRHIVQTIWPTLKSGGYLIYSTCTYNLKENEENVAWISQSLDAEIVALPIDPSWNIVGNLMTGADFPVYHFLPHRTRGEGFFLAVLKKKGMTVEETPHTHNPGTTRPIEKECRDWIKHAEAYNRLNIGHEYYALPQSYDKLIRQLLNTLHVILPGVPYAEQRGKDLTPHPALGTSCLLNRLHFPQIDLEYKDALTYLRGEILRLPPTSPKGYTLVTNKNEPLGFVKNIGNRANNLYPVSRRIRSGYLPDRSPDWYAFTTSANRPSSF